MFKYVPLFRTLCKILSTQEAFMWRRSSGHSLTEYDAVSKVSKLTNGDALRPGIAGATGLQSGQVVAHLWDPGGLG